MPATVSTHFTAGLLLRRQFRRELQKANLDFSEEKGVLDSLFVVRGSPGVIDAVNNWLRKVQAEFND